MVGGIGWVIVFIFFYVFFSGRDVGRLYKGWIFLFERFFRYLFIRIWVCGKGFVID